MDRTEAISKARALMNQHALGHIPVEITRGRRAIGSTWFQGDDFVTKITFSGPWIDVMTWDQFSDIVLHEIAHAIAGRKAGHNWQWKATARRIGANPEREHDDPNVKVEGKYTLICPNGHRSAIYGMLQRPRSCSKCHRGWNLDYLMVMHEGDQPVPQHKLSAKYRDEIRSIALRKSLGMKR